jgi:hypothetical protein
MSECSGDLCWKGIESMGYRMAHSALSAPHRIRVAWKPFRDRILDGWLKISFSCSWTKVQYKGMTVSGIISARGYPMTLPRASYAFRLRCWGVVTAFNSAHAMREFLRAQGGNANPKQRMSFLDPSRERVLCVR